MGREEQWRLVATENVCGNARDSKGGRSQAIANGLTLKDAEGGGGVDFRGKWEAGWDAGETLRALWMGFQ